MLQDLAVSFTSVFVALDIIGVLPLFISLTNSLGYETKKNVIDRSMIVALIVALVFTFLGTQIFHYLGINIFDFKIAGGLILLLVSIADLVGGPEAKTQVSGSTGVVPLAVPLITGPAVVTTLMLQVGTYGYVVTLISLLGNYLIAWGLLRKSETVTRVIGDDGTVIVSKIAAMLLVAIAVSMMRSGVFEAIRAFNQ